VGSGQNKFEEDMFREYIQIKAWITATIRTLKNNHIALHDFKTLARCIKPVSPVNLRKVLIVTSDCGVK
jgi:hypothetical protein